MASYTINNLNAGSLQSITTTPGKTLLAWWATTGATTLRRVWLTELEWGAADVPNATDCPIVVNIMRFTADGTGSALVARTTDDGPTNDPVALATYKANYSAEPTFTASTSVFGKSINQRASDKQWWRDKATCPISAAVNLQGWGVRAYSPNYASTVIANGHVEE
jgi:hypothetical protein